MEAPMNMQIETPYVDCTRELGGEEYARVAEALAKELFFSRLSMVEKEMLITVSGAFQRNLHALSSTDEMRKKILKGSSLKDNPDVEMDVRKVWTSTLLNELMIVLLVIGEDRPQLLSTIDNMLEQVKQLTLPRQVHK